MEDLRFIQLNKRNAAPFAPYLLPRMRELLARGEELLVLGAAAETYSLGAVAAHLLPQGVVQLRSVFVDPGLRRRGVGSALLRELCRVCAAETGEPVQRVDAEFIADPETCDALTGFLGAMGFTVERAEGRIFCVDSTALHDRRIMGEIFSPAFREDPHVRMLSALTAEQLREIEESDAPSFLKPGFVKATVLRRASAVWLEDGHPLGWVLFSSSVDGELVLSAAYRDDSTPQECFFCMLKAAANRCYMMYGRDCKVYITAINERVASLIENLAGGELQEFAHYAATTGRRTPAWMQG